MTDGIGGTDARPINPYSRKPLKLPLVSEELRPVYDANGVLVSIYQHAQAFVDAMNLVWAISEGKVSGDAAISTADAIVKKVQS